MGAALPARAQFQVAAEWSNGSVITLPSLPGSTSSAAHGINNAGEAVGQSFIGGLSVATGWSGGGVVNLGLLPGSRESFAAAINMPGRR